MNTICTILRALGFICVGMGIGMQVSFYLIKESNWHDFSLSLVGLFIVPLGAFIAIIRSKEQREDLKMKSIKRYERMEELFGDNNLFIVRWAGILSMISGISLIILTYFSDGIDEMYSTIGVLVVFAGFLVVGFAMDVTRPLLLQFRIKKQ